MALRDVDGQDRGLDGAVGGHRPRPRAHRRDDLRARSPGPQPVLIGRPDRPDRGSTVARARRRFGGDRRLCAVRRWCPPGGALRPGHRRRRADRAGPLRLDRPVRAHPTGVRDRPRVVPPPRARRRGRPQGPPATQARAVRRQPLRGAEDRPLPRGAGGRRVRGDPGLPRRRVPRARPPRRRLQARRRALRSWRSAPTCSGTGRVRCCTPSSITSSTTTSRWCGAWRTTSTRSSGPSSPAAAVRTRSSASTS